MPSGIINQQISQDQLKDQLRMMKNGGTIEILTGDYVEKYSDNEYSLNFDDKIFCLTDIVDMIYCANRPFFVDIPEESYIKGFMLGENTGGNIINDIVVLKDDKVLVITGDAIYIYKDYEAYQNNDNEIGFLVIP